MKRPSLRRHIGGSGEEGTDEQKAAAYTVRLGFNALPGDRKGQRIFDIKLQDKVVVESFDILETAGKANRAVAKEFKEVRAESVLVLELLPKSANPQENQAPLISFIEVIREDAGQITQR